MLLSANGMIGDKSIINLQELLTRAERNVNTRGEARPSLTPGRLLRNLTLESRGGRAASPIPVADEPADDLLYGSRFSFTISVTSSRKRKLLGDNELKSVTESDKMRIDSQRHGPRTRDVLPCDH